MVEIHKPLKQLVKIKARVSVSLPLKHPAPGDMVNSLIYVTYIVNSLRLDVRKS